MLRRSASIVALHGYLGSPADWDGFDVTPIRIPASINEILIPKSSILMGYSMGGRIALELATKTHCSGLILIGANPGLMPHEIAARQKFEDHWLYVFKTSSYKQALQLWYSQPIFDSLRASSGFKNIFARRLSDPSPWLYMKTYRLKQLPIPSIPILYVYGERDLKYAKISKRFENSLMIPGTGHAPHLENPKLFNDLVSRYCGWVNNDLLKV